MAVSRHKGTLTQSKTITHEHDRAYQDSASSMPHSTSTMPASPRWFLTSGLHCAQLYSAAAALYCPSGWAVRISVTRDETAPALVTARCTHTWGWL